MAISTIVRGTLAVLALCLVLGTGGQAQEAASTSGAERVTTLRSDAAAPFGALSLLAIAGALGAGILVGAAAVAWRNGARAPAASAATERTDPEPAATEPAVMDPAATEAAMGSGATDDDPAKPAMAVDAATNSAASVRLSFDGDDTVEEWLGDLANGPRFGPRLVGIVAAKDCNVAEALSCLAEAAQTSDWDVALIDAAGTATELASALDRRLGSRDDHDRLGAQARVEIVPLADLVPPDGRLSAAAWREQFDLLAARADIILVALPPPGEWTRIRSFLEALDDVVVLRGPVVRRAEIVALADAARNRGVPVSGQIVVEALAA